MFWSEAVNQYYKCSYITGNEPVFWMSLADGLLEVQTWEETAGPAGQETTTVGVAEEDAIWGAAVIDVLGVTGIRALRISCSQPFNKTINDAN